MRKERGILQICILMSSMFFLSTIIDEQSNQVIAVPTLPDQNGWENQGVNVRGDWGVIRKISNNDFRIYIKEPQSSPAGSSDSTASFLYSTTDFRSLYNKIDVGTNDVRDMIWVGDKFIALRQSSGSIYLGELDLDGTYIDSASYKTSRYALGGHALFQDENSTIYEYYRASSYNHLIQELNGLTFFGSEINTLGNVWDSYQYHGYDIFQDSENQFHFIYENPDNTVNIRTTSQINDWSIATENIIASGYTPIQIEEIDGNIVVFLGKSAVSSINGQSYYETFYSYSTDLITWSSPQRFSMDNAMSKYDSQIIILDDNSFVFMYASSDKVHIYRSAKLVTSEISISDNQISSGEVVELTAVGQFVNNSALSYINVIWDVYFPNGTLYFSWVEISDNLGVSTLMFSLPSNITGGVYKVVVNYQVPNVGYAIDWTTFNYLYRDSSIPIAMTNVTHTFTSGTLSVDIEGQYDETSAYEFYFTLSIMDPFNQPYDSITLSSFIQGTFQINFTYNISNSRELLSGIYTSQIILRLDDPLEDGLLVDYYEFTFEV